MATLVENHSAELPLKSTSGRQSLSDIFRTVHVPVKASWLRRFLAFSGPAYLVGVGYMDPGNWGTDLAGGSKLGYSLLWVVLLSNLIAQFLQVLCTRLGLVTGKDLAMACREYYSRPVAIGLWLLCEIAIIACDLAEVVGSAVALNLLFSIPLIAGVIITAFDVLLLLGFMRLGFRKIEAIILALIAIVFGCFLFELTLANPDWGAAAVGMFVPRLPNSEALLIALGILGATVMPHNLYLHSSLVQTRKTGASQNELEQAIHFNTADTVLALSIAFLVNAAILVLAAAVFHSVGRSVEELSEGQFLLSHALGKGAALAFAIALLASGQSSTITGTLAGQVVMEGFLHFKMNPWVRRLVTRSLAVIPAIFVLQVSGGTNTVQLLVISQIVLSMQLPFAIFPLVAITSDRKWMGSFVSPRWIKVTGYGIASAITALNVYLVFAAF